jgi:hypothetical protein
MSIPITTFLFIYLILVLGWLVFSFFNIFHAIKFGLDTKANKITLVVYITLSSSILLGSLIYIATVDWTQKIELLSII